MDKLNIIKIGGNVIDDENELNTFLINFSMLKGKKILVHGGGKLADKMLKKLDIIPQKVNGRRITDKSTIEVVTMVYAGIISKSITAILQKNNCNAIGLSGCDANIISANIRSKDPIDFGFVGDINSDSVNISALNIFLNNGLIPVISPITHDGKGELLNTNADTIASQIAISMSKDYEVNLYYCFEKLGVLSNTDDNNSVINEINKSNYLKLIEIGTISQGMLPKLQNAFDAINSNVNKVTICHHTEIQNIIDNCKQSGTTINA